MENTMNDCNNDKTPVQIGRSFFVTLVSNEENPVKITQRWKTLVKNFSDGDIVSIEIVESHLNEYWQRACLFKVEIINESLHKR